MDGHEAAAVPAGPGPDGGAADHHAHPKALLQQPDQPLALTTVMADAARVHIDLIQQVAQSSENPATATITDIDEWQHRPLGQGQDAVDAEGAFIEDLIAVLALACQPGRVCHLQGYLPGRLQSLDFCLRRPAALETLTSGVVKTGVVAGEVPNPRAAAPPWCATPAWATGRSLRRAAH